MGVRPLCLLEYKAEEHGIFVDRARRVRAVDGSETRTAWSMAGTSVNRVWCDDERERAR
ncbi:MAG: hypothetical protein J07HQX50_01987 [Haloquadratum sp. J07HQX50]|nr:MAG: hypothetical protein J07HQX50_01987 [Haloquadratum sp. J07HQX50]